MQFYCSEYCKYHSVCNKTYTPKLQTTINALEAVNLFEDFKNLDYNEYPAKTYALKCLVSHTRNEIRLERAKESK